MADNDSNNRRRVPSVARFIEGDQPASDQQTDTSGSQADNQSAQQPEENSQSLFDSDTDTKAHTNDLDAFYHGSDDPDPTRLDDRDTRPTSDGPVWYDNPGLEQERQSAKRNSARRQRLRKFFFRKRVAQSNRTNGIRGRLEALASKAGETISHAQSGSAHHGEVAHEAPEPIESQAKVKNQKRAQRPHSANRNVKPTRGPRIVLAMILLLVIGVVIAAKQGLVPFAPLQNLQNVADKYVADYNDGGHAARSTDNTAEVDTSGGIAGAGNNVNPRQGDQSLSMADDDPVPEADIPAAGVSSVPPTSTPADARTTVATPSLDGEFEQESGSFDVSADMSTFEKSSDYSSTIDGVSETVDHVMTQPAPPSVEDRARAQLTADKGDNELLGTSLEIPNIIPSEIIGTAPSESVAKDKPMGSDATKGQTEQDTSNRDPGTGESMTEAKVASSTTKEDSGNDPSKADEQVASAPQAVSPASVTDVADTADRSDDDTDIADLKKRVASLESTLKESQNRINKLKSQATTKPHRSPRDNHTSKPNLEIQTISIARYCNNCLPMVTGRYKGRTIHLSDGDSFHGYTVDIQGDRMLLSRGSTQYSYYPGS